MRWSGPQCLPTRQAQPTLLLDGERASAPDSGTTIWRVGSNESQLARAVEAAGESAALARDALHAVGGIRLRDPSPADADCFAEAGTRLRRAVADLDQIRELLRALRDRHDG